MSNQKNILYNATQHESCLDLVGNTRKMMNHIETSKFEIPSNPESPILYSGKFCIGNGTYPSCPTYHYNCHEFENYVDQHNITNKTKIHVWKNSSNTIRYSTLKLYNDEHGKQIVDVKLD